MMTISTRLAPLGLGFALIFFCASPPAEATTIRIDDVKVQIGTTIYTAATVGWTFPVMLSKDENLVLTQDFQGVPAATTSYNFDTSDGLAQKDPFLLPSIAITTFDGITSMTTTFTDFNQVLSVNNQGSGPPADNEAQDYGMKLVGPGYDVYLGYADNVHPHVCGGSSTCLPSIFSGLPFPFFQGTGGLDPGPPQVSPNHCTDALHNCYDAGVIRIVATDATAVPEPATVTLLLTGVAGLAARRYHGQARKKAV